MPYALIRDGVIVETADSIEPGSLQEQRGAKPYWLPLVDEKPSHDADVETLDVSIAIGARQVTRNYARRPRTEAELTALRARPLAGIELAFAQRVAHARLVLATLAACGVDVPKRTAREDALAAVRDAKRAEVGVLTSAAALGDYDAATGWD